MNIGRDAGQTIFHPYTPNSRRNNDTSNPTGGVRGVIQIKEFINPLKIIL